MRRMARGAEHRTGLAALLALLALVMNLVVPPGTMVAARPHGPAIVICTGHGPAARPDQPTPADHGKAGHDGSCTFAGHGVASPPPPLAVADPAFIVAATGPEPVGIDQAPGLGLAAPPPPSQAPPLLV